MKVVSNSIVAFLKVSHEITYGFQWLVLLDLSSTWPSNAAGSMNWLKYVYELAVCKVSDVGMQFPVYGARVLNFWEKWMKLKL